MNEPMLQGMMKRSRFTQTHRFIDLNIDKDLINHLVTLNSLFAFYGQTPRNESLIAHAIGLLHFRTVFENRFTTSDSANSVQNLLSDHKGNLLVCSDFSKIHYVRMGETNISCTEFMML